MTVVIPPGGFVISFTKPVPPVKVQVHYDVCPTWCELALKHLADAKDRAEERIQAWTGADENAKGITLEREFESSMQAIMAAAIAVDAFYAVIQTHVVLPAGLIEQWRKGRTARYSQVCQVISRAFKLKPEGAQILKFHLKQIYRLRDLAVHPTGKLGEPILHPEIDVGVEWRFISFRATNAELVVHHATAVLWQLANTAQPKSEQTKRYVAALSKRLKELFPSGHPFCARVNSGMTLNPSLQRTAPAVPCLPLNKR